MEYQVSADSAAKLAAAHADRAAEKMRAAMAPQRADALGLLGGGYACETALMKSGPMLDQIFERIATRNDQLREVIGRLEAAMDRMQPVGVNRATDNEAPEASGIIGRIEAAVDSQGELISRLRSVASHLDTIA